MRYMYIISRKKIQASAELNMCELEGRGLATYIYFEEPCSK